MSKYLRAKAAALPLEAVDVARQFARPSLATWQAFMEQMSAAALEHATGRKIDAPQIAVLAVICLLEQQSRDVSLEMTAPLWTLAMALNDVRNGVLPDAFKPKMTSKPGIPAEILALRQTAVLAVQELLDAGMPLPNALAKVAGKLPLGIKARNHGDLPNTVKTWWKNRRNRSWDPGFDVSLGRWRSTFAQKTGTEGDPATRAERLLDLIAAAEVPK